VEGDGRSTAMAMVMGGGHGTVKRDGVRSVEHSHWDRDGRITTMETRRTSAI
jgi:hypothetical protein